MSTYRINHNASANLARNSVNDISNRLDKFKDQLSTGIKTNRASDKPEDFIKAENFKVEILKTDQAKSNALDAINYTRAASTQMNEITNLLYKIQGFAQQIVQNVTTDSDQLNALNIQLKKTISTIDNTAKSAAYGNKKILDGSAGTTVSSTSDNIKHITFTGNFAGQPITEYSTKLTTATTTSTKVTTTAPVVVTPATQALLTGTTVFNTSSSNPGGGAVVTTLDITGPLGNVLISNGLNASNVPSTLQLNTSASNLMRAINNTTVITGVAATYDSVAKALKLNTTTTGADKIIRIIDKLGFLYFGAHIVSASGTDALTSTTTTTTTTTATTITTNTVTTSITASSAPADRTGNITYVNYASILNKTGSITITGPKGSATINYTSAQKPIDLMNNINNVINSTGVYAYQNPTTNIVMHLKTIARGSAATITLTDSSGVISTPSPVTSAGTNPIVNTTSNTNTIINPSPITTIPGTTTATLVGTSHGGYLSTNSTLSASGTITLNEATSLNFTSGVSTVQNVLDFANSVSGITATFDPTTHQITLTKTVKGFNTSIHLADSAGIIGDLGTDSNVNAISTQKTTIGVINMSLTQAAAPATIIGTTYSYSSTAANLTSTGNININGHSIGTFTTSNTVQNVLDAINNAGLGLTATLSNNKIVLTSKAMGSDQVINLTDTGGIIITPGNNIVSGTDAVASITIGETTTVFNKGKGTLLVDADGNQIKLSTAGNNLALNTSIIIGQVSAGNNLFCIDSSNTQSLSIPSCTPDNLGLNAVTGQSLATINLTSPNNAMITLKVVDQAIKDIYHRRTVLENIQKNSLEPALRSLTVSKENLQTSESNIQNLDVAEAITQATRLQILTQSGIAQLAQANQAPSAILNLLRGG